MYPSPGGLEKEVGGRREELEKRSQKKRSQESDMRLLLVLVLFLVIISVGDTVAFSTHDSH